MLEIRKEESFAQVRLEVVDLEIQAQNISKRFTREWVFKNFDYTFKKGEAYALLGNNGSGKSTLIQCLMGVVPITKGGLNYLNSNEVISPDNWYKHIAFAAPYLELIEEFTLEEIVKFHNRFRHFVEGIGINEFLELSQLENQKNKQIKFFSSGMKQRLRLSLSFYFQSDILFLDEPISNLDEYGINWYQTHVESIKENKILIIGSNNKPEYEICDKYISLNDYKL